MGYGSLDQSSEQGITLLLAILVLAVITAISFSLATIVFIEIRASADVLHTEPALYAAQSITEEGIYNLKRKPPGFVYSTTINGITLLEPVLQQLNTSPYVIIVTAAATSTYQIFDPNNPNGPPGYGSIKITYQNTGVSGPVNLTMTQYNADGTTQVITGSSAPPINPGDAWQAGLNPSLQYQLVVQNQTSPPGSATLIIETWDGSGSPKGLPYASERVLDITANYPGGLLTRKYQVKVPYE